MGFLKGFFMSSPLEPRNVTLFGKVFAHAIKLKILRLEGHPQSDSQFSSVAQSHPTLCDPMDRSTPGLPVHHQLPELLKLMSIESVMPSNHLILCRPLPLLPSVFPSIRVFSNESVFHIS